MPTEIPTPAPVDLVAGKCFGRVSFKEDKIVKLVTVHPLDSIMNVFMT